jgi:hypothetical protein
LTPASIHHEKDAQSRSRDEQRGRSRRPNKSWPEPQADRFEQRGPGLGFDLPPDTLPNFREDIFVESRCGKLLEQLPGFAKFSGGDGASSAALEMRVD